MNAAGLLKHYDRIADAPDAVAKLRRLILDLAVRGKLVSQDPTDERVSELLKRTAAVKRRLLEAGEIGDQKKLSVEEIEAEFEVPAAWRWVRLGQVTSYVQRGKSPKCAEIDGAVVVSQKCVQWHGLDLGVARRITFESLADYDDVRFLRHGDLLWNSTGTGTIGRIVRLKAPPDKLVCDSHVTVVRCLNVDPEYIRVWLRSDSVYGRIEGRAAGSTNQVELTAQMAVNQIIPLAPFAAQQRIVAKVDELVDLCDQLEAARAEREARRDRLARASLSRLNTPDPSTFHEDARVALEAFPVLTARSDQIKQLRQKILNLAMLGKIEPQLPEAESASERLSRVSTLKVQFAPRAWSLRHGEKSIRRQPTLRDLPDGWVWTNLGAITLEMRYGTSKKCGYELDGVPVLRIPNVSGGTVNLDDLKFGPLSTNEIEELALRRGDLLVIRSNGSLDIVGSAAEVGSEAEGMAFAGYLVRIRLSVDNVLPRFICLAMQTESARHQIEKPIRSAVGLKNINSSEIAALTFPLPPLSEQYRIVAKVDELMALCDRLQASLEATAATRSRLLDALLQEALVPAIEMQEAA
jgi:type I restriction enzyme S subunit